MLGLFVSVESKGMGVHCPNLMVAPPNDPVADALESCVMAPLNRGEGLVTAVVDMERTLPPAVTM